MNWSDIKHPPKHNKDVLIAGKDIGWMQAHFDGSTWLDRAGFALPEIVMKHMSFWTEVKLPN